MAVQIFFPLVGTKIRLQETVGNDQNRVLVGRNIIHGVDQCYFTYIPIKMEGLVLYLDHGAVAGGINNGRCHGLAVCCGEVNNPHREEQYLFHDSRFWLIKTGDQGRFPGEVGILSYTKQHPVKNLYLAF